MNDFTAQWQAWREMFKASSAASGQAEDVTEALLTDAEPYARLVAEGTPAIVAIMALCGRLRGIEVDPATLRRPKARPNALLSVIAGGKAG